MRAVLLPRCHLVAMLRKRANTGEMAELRRAKRAQLIPLIPSMRVLIPFLISSKSHLLILSHCGLGLNFGHSRHSKGVLQDKGNSP